jgi:cell division protein FtsW
VSATAASINGSRPGVVTAGAPPRYSASLIGCALALSVLGLVMVASASTSVADARYGHPLALFWRQLAYLAVALACALTVSRIPCVVWRHAGPWLLILGTVLLALVLVPGIGREVNGSMRWLGMGPVNLQPSEFIKVFAVVYLAGYLVRRQDQVRTALSGFCKPIVLIALICGLLILEPDFGATAVLFTTTLCMLFIAGVPFLIFSTLALAVVSVFAVAVWFSPERWDRIRAFTDPWHDDFRLNDGYQLTQALMAIGRGEWSGVGLGQSVQKLHYLPEAHTDFLFAVLAEELGLIGVLLVILAFTYLVWRAFAAGARAQAAGDAYSGHLAYGLGVLLGLQAFVNMGVNLGLLPTKGLTLPLMSYGGSSLVATAVLMGLLVRVDAESGAHAQGRPAASPRRSAGEAVRAPAEEDA